MAPWSKGTAGVDFEETWGRYLPGMTPTPAAPDGHVNGYIVPSAQKGPIDRLHCNIAVNNIGFTRNAAVTSNHVLPTESVENHSSGHQCYRVTDENPSGSQTGVTEPDEGTGIDDDEVIL